MKVKNGVETIEFPDDMQRDDIRAALEQRNNSNVVEVMRKVAKVETGGEKNPFIRTRAIPKKGSTAYGPLQLIRKTAKGYLQPKFSEIFSPDEVGYLKRFVDQGDKFNNFGDNPAFPDEEVKEREGYDSKYDYGGEGDLGSPEDRDMYWQVISKIFKHELKGDYSAKNVAKIWHGGDDEGKIKNYEKKLRAAGLTDEVESDDR